MRHDDARLVDIVNACRTLDELAKGVTRQTLEADVRTQLAFVHLIQIIGEASGGLSEACRTRHSQVPWDQIIGMRHRIVHDYLNIDLDIVWRVVQNDAPKLRAELENLIPPP